MNVQGMYCELETVEYLDIKGFNEIGRFCVDYSINKEEIKVMLPKIKVEKFGDSRGKHILEPGYLDREGNFFPCPLQIFYIQLYKIIQEEKYERYSDYCKTEAHIKIFSKDFSKYISKVLIYERKSREQDFRQFNWVFNLLNNYIEADKEIDRLDFSKFRYRGLLPGLDKKDVLHAINNLQINFFDNSLNRAGKDNYFWMEGEVRNLPKDKYLRQLIVDGLKKQCEGVQLTDFGLIMTFWTDTAWAPSFSRRMVDEIEQKKYDLNLRDNLKFDLATTYNKQEHIFENLTSDLNSNDNDILEVIIYKD